MITGYCKKQEHRLYNRQVILNRAEVPWGNIILSIMQDNCGNTSREAHQRLLLFFWKKLDETLSPQEYKILRLLVIIKMTFYGSPTSRNEQTTKPNERWPPVKNCPSRQSRGLTASLLRRIFFESARFSPIRRFSKRFLLANRLIRESRWRQRSNRRRSRLCFNGSAVRNTISANRHPRRAIFGLPKETTKNKGRKGQWQVVVWCVFAKKWFSGGLVVVVVEEAAVFRV